MPVLAVITSKVASIIKDCRRYFAKTRETK